MLKSGMFKCFPWVPWEEQGMVGGVARAMGWWHLGGLVTSHGPGATSWSWCHLGVLVPPRGPGVTSQAGPAGPCSPPMESPQSNPCPPTPPGTVCPLPSDTALPFVTMPWLQPCQPCAPGMISRDTWGAPQPEFLFAKMDFGSLQHQENAPVASSHSEPLPPQPLQAFHRIHTRCVLSSALLPAGLIPRGSAWKKCQKFLFLTRRDLLTVTGYQLRPALHY